MYCASCVFPCQSEEIVHSVYHEEIEEEEPQLTRSGQTGVVIDRAVHTKSDEGTQTKKASKQDFILQQHPKGSGEGSNVTPEVPNGLSQKGPNKGFGMTPMVLDEPKDSSSSSSSESKEEIKDISSDDKSLEANDIEKNMRLKLMMAKLIKRRAIGKFVQAHLKKNLLPKDVPDIRKMKQNKVAKQSMPKFPTIPFDEASLMEYDQKDKLLKIMLKSKSYDKDPTHRALYDALVQSLLVDENDMDK
nr:hypothetical protein [Tanacetum cinerariifolium]